MNRFLFNEPHGSLGFVLETPWSGPNLQVGTHTIPAGYMALLWIAEYENPAANHYWTGRFNATLGLGNSRFEFAVKATGSEDVAFHTMQPTRGGTSAAVWRWTSSLEGELDLPSNTIDVFVGDLNTPMTKGTSATVGIRPTVIATGGRVQFNTLSSRLSNLFSTADVLPDEKIIAWWEELRAALQP